MIVLTKTHFPFSATEIGIAALCYIPIGIIWSLFNFYFLNVKFAEVYAGLRQGYDYVHANRKIQDYAYECGFDCGYPLVATKYKSYIIGSMIYWPVSMMRYICSDPIIRLYNMIFGWFRGLFEQITHAQSAEWRKDSVHRNK